VLTTIFIALSSPLVAQTGDAPPVDTVQLLHALKQLREQNETSMLARRTNAYRQLMAAAASNEKAAAFWADAVLAVQFAGVDHQTTAVREWKQGEGEGLRSKEASNAARLHLQWMALTIQHASGIETKQLLNNVVDFARQVDADGAMIGRVGDKIDKAREQASAGKRPPITKALADNTQAKRVHDQIMRMSVANGPVARWLQISEFLSPAGAKKKGEGAEGATWELVPGNVTGIYNAIILPEFRASRDPRLLEYWDMVLKAGADGIYPGMPDFEERRWTQVRRPSLLWSRAQDVLILGQRNRAITEMFNLIKAYPQHPEAAGWMAQLEGCLNPSAARQASATNGGPGVPPTATILPVQQPGTPPVALPATP
jgi:hypothetical protein